MRLWRAAVSCFSIAFRLMLLYCSCVLGYCGLCIFLCSPNRRPLLRGKYSLVQMALCFPPRKLQDSYYSSEGPLLSAAHAQDIMCAACWGSRCWNWLAMRTPGSCSRGFSQLPWRNMKCCSSQGRIGEHRIWPRGPSLEPPDLRKGGIETLNE